MLQWIKQLFQNLLLLILKLVDGITQMFNILLGVDNVWYNKGDGTGESVTLLDFFLSQELVVQIFLVLFVLSIILIAVSCVVAIIRSMFFPVASGGANERKTATRILGQGLTSVISTLVCVVVTVLAIWGCNLFIKVVHKSFTPDGSPISISRSILELGVQNGRKWDTATMEELKRFQLTEGQDCDYDKMSDDYNSHTEAENALKNNPIWDEENGTWLWVIYLDNVNGVADEAKFNALFQNGYLKSGVTAEDIWGTPTTNKIGIPNGGWTPGALHGDLYNALVPYVATVILVYVLLVTCFDLVKRVFDIMSLFFVMPFCNATVPLDDGAHMKLWRETMISKVLMAYGAVFAIGVFSIVTPYVGMLTVGQSGFINICFRLILICGAGLTIRGGITLFARLVGTGVAEGNDLAQTAKSLLAGGLGALMMGGKALKLGKNLLFGREKMGGGKTPGLFGHIGKGLDKTGKLLGGNAYKNTRNSVSDKLKGALGGAKSRIMNSNGLIGGAGRGIRNMIPKNNNGLGGSNVNNGGFIDRG